MGLQAARGRPCAGATIAFLALLGGFACATRSEPALREGSPAMPGPAAADAPEPGAPAGEASVPSGGSEPGGVANVAASPAAGAAGSYLDDQARRVQDAVPDASVQRQEDRLLVTLPGDVVFASGSATLSPVGSERLRSLADTLNAYPDTDVVVKGYTDAQGSEAFNLKLSEDRADRVRDYLMTRGVAGRRLKSVGFGPQFPVATNDTPEGRQQNRRVELELRPGPSLRARDAQGATP